MSEGAIPFILLGFSVLLTAIMSMIGFIVYGITKKLDGLQTKEICEILHKDITKDINNIAEIARGAR